MRRLKDINWNQVYYFYEVAKRGSMKEAARTLSISVPTISEQIKRLEVMLGLELFKRTSRTLKLTDNGLELFNCSREIFAAGVRFLDKVSPSPIGGYCTRVGVQETISASVALDFLYMYEELFTPFGTVNTFRESFAETICHKIIRGELDWGITLETAKQSRLTSQVIDSFDIVFCCSHEVYNKFVNKEDILRYLPLARSFNDRGLNHIVSSHLESLNIAPEEIIESDFIDYCLGLAYRGRCVAPIALKAIESSPWNSKVKTFVIGKPITLSFYATWSKSNERMVAIRKLLTLLAPAKSKNLPSPKNDDANQQESKTT